jgi:hypothetical protein
MKTRRRLSGPAVPSLLVAVAGAVVLAGAAVAALVPTSKTVPIAGTVFGLPESVYFSGSAQISTRPVEGRIPGASPHVVVSIDLGGVSGVGLSTKATYLASGQANLTRWLVASDLVQVTFPFSGASGRDSAVRTALATFNLSFDVATGALTGATASISAPNLPN